MTAIIIARQHDRVHLVTDAAVYTRDQVVASFGNKVYSAPHIPCVITVTGNAAATECYGSVLTNTFSTFDDMIAGAEVVISELMKLHPLPGGGTDIMMAGVSASRGPEAYYFRTNDDLPLAQTREEVEASELFAPPGTLVKLPDLVVSPVPHDQVAPANYEGIDPDALEWSFRKILEMMRHTTLPEGIGGIGGFATMTTITADSIEQRVIQRWPDDKLGEPLRPGPIDWQKWHAENPKPAARKLRVVQ